jgi:osmotically-inducible protein OsmY
MMRPVFLVSTAFVFAAIACDRGPNTEENIRKALDQANMNAVQVDVDDEARIVHLQGTVGTMADRTRANEIATAVVGTSGRVLNELTVEGLTSRSADDFDGQITDRLDELLDSDAVLRERDVNLQVIHGMVAITGEVRTADEKNKVEQLVRAAPGVKDVANGLQIRNEP